MPKKCGRPAKGEDHADCRQQILDATINLILEKGADSVTVRSVCAEADLSIGTFYHHFRDKDDLFMSFLREPSFADCPLETPMASIGCRITELYMHLIDRYKKIGLDFMKGFYTSGNRSLSAYMCEADGRFEEGTVMSRSETELLSAQKQGLIKESANVHEICMDICTIVKGCIFEWCLTDGDMDIERTLNRILCQYIQEYLE